MIIIQGILLSSYLSSIIKKNIRLKSYFKLSHLTHIKQKNCPCSKGEYCTNGLKCTDQNCFLLKSSTFVTRSVTMPIEAVTPLDRFYPLTTDKASHYIHSDIKGSYNSTLNKSGDSIKLIMP